MSMSTPRKLVRTTQSIIAATALALLAPFAGCGAMPDEESTSVDEGELKNGLIITCPQQVTVAWTQAANGRTNTFGNVKAIIPRDQPITTLRCAFERSTAPLIQQIVSFKPNSVESVCGAKAVISGRGTTSGAVPPFEPFIFKTKKIEATHTYEKASGICLLTIPTLPVGNGHAQSPEFDVKVSKGCETRSDDVSFLCPSNVQPLD